MNTTTSPGTTATVDSQSAASSTPLANAALDLQRRAQELETIKSIQDLIAGALLERIQGDEWASPAEPLIEATTAESDLIVHLATFSPFDSLGGGYAFTVHSGHGFHHSAERYGHLTERELEAQALIEALHALKGTPGRLTIYSTSDISAELLHGQAQLWRPRQGRFGIRSEDGAWWHLVQALFSEREAGITAAITESSPMLEYCEHLAWMYYASASASIPDRAAVLHSLANN